MLRFTNSKGDYVEFKGGTNFRIFTFEGLDESSVDVQMQSAPFQDGTTYIDNQLNPRSISIEFGIFALSKEQVYDFRRYLSKVFNPKTGLGTLTHEMAGQVREIQAITESGPFYAGGSDNETQRFQRGTIHLICPSPLWKDITSKNYKLEDFIGKFRFPLRFPVRFAARGDSRTLLNNGDVPTPIKVEFRGPVTNPKITNLNTGEFIKVNATIPENYKLIIDTSFGNKRVEIVAPDGIVQNAFHHIDLESTFFNLDVGENRISFITEGGYPEVFVEYKHRYLSV